MESGCHHAFSPADGAVINALLSASLLFSEAFRNDFFFGNAWKDKTDSIN
jgi:hypothetical protein